MKSECCHQHPDNGSNLAVQTEAQAEETDLRAVNAKLVSALEKAEYLFGSVRIEIVAEDYDKANDAAAKGESLCCEAIEEARK